MHTMHAWMVVLKTVFIFPFVQEWNDELSYLAQFWASGCEYETNENRNTQSVMFESVGENFIATASFTINYTILIQNSWFNQGKSYDYFGGTCTDEDGNQADGLEGCEYYVQVKICKP